MRTVLVALIAVYRFVVGDPILLGGTIVALVLAHLLRQTGSLAGGALFAAVAATLALSLALRPQ